MYSQLELDAEQSRSLASIWRTDWWWSTVRGRSRGWQVGMRGLGTPGSCKSSPLVHKDQEKGMQLKSLAIIFLEPLKDPWRHGCNWLRVCVEAQSPCADRCPWLAVHFPCGAAGIGLVRRGPCARLCLYRGAPLATSQQVSCSTTTRTTGVTSSSQSKLSPAWWHRAGAMGSLGFSKVCRALSDALDGGQGSMGWAGEACQVSPLSRRQLLPCSAGWIPSGFLLFPAFPMGPSVVKVQSSPYSKLSALWQLYSAWTGLSASVHFSAKSVSNWGCLGVTVKTGVPSFVGYFEKGCVRDKMPYMM